ncbi:MAG: hypothetical protein OEP95_02165 [Myxococcales bacterium]|nr:hypothetical protein [Myxococcales bacterium]
MIAGIWFASAAVLGACVLASFRIDFGSDPQLLLQANGARALLGAAAGAGLALGASLRLRGKGRPLAELEVVAAATGAAVGGFVAVSWLPDVPVPVLAAVFSLAATAGAAAGWAVARALDRGSRWSNLGVALLLAAIVGGAAVAGSYVGARLDFVQPTVRWLLGDLAHAALPSAALLAAAVVAAGAYGAARIRSEPAVPLAGLGWLVTGLAIGAAGPLAFVGSFVPRAVAGLAPTASAAARLATSMAAGAATVVALDSVPRLLVGGYALPFNVAATMLAVPVLLLWNRARLRRQLGVSPRLLEGVELVGILGATATAVAFAWVLTAVVRGAT